MLRCLIGGGFCVFLLALSGCGQKGDLYLPQSKNAPMQASSMPSKAQSSSLGASSSESRAAK